MYVCMYVCMYVYMYVCMYVYTQVRAVSQHNAEGLWSDPLCIELPARPSPVTANTALPTPTDPPQG